MEGKGLVGKFCYVDSSGAVPGMIRVELSLVINFSPS